MSPGLVKMWVSLSGLGFMFVSVILIYLSRFKLKGFFKVLFAIIAYGFMILSGLLILIVVLSGP